MSNARPTAKRSLSITDYVVIALSAIFIITAVSVWRHGELEAGRFALLWILSVIGMVLSLSSKDSWRGATAAYITSVTILLLWGVALATLTVSIIVIGAESWWV